MRTHRILWAAVALAFPGTLYAQDPAGGTKTAQETPNRLVFPDYAGRFELYNTPSDGRAHLNLNTNVANTDYFRGGFDGVTGGLNDYRVEIDPTLVFQAFSDPHSAVNLNMVLGVQNSVSGASPFGDQAVGPRIWYEANPFVGAMFNVGPGIRAGVTYTVYTSPNNTQPQEQEVAMSAGFGGFTPIGFLNPYGEVALQVKTPNGQHGYYAEAGIAPKIAIPKNAVGQFELTMPVRVGGGFNDYYTHTIPGLTDTAAVTSGTPGFVSAGLHLGTAVGAVRSDLGAWHLTAGVDALIRNDRLASAANVDDSGNLVWTGMLGLDIAY
jgi:hypothetical protein